MKSSRHNNSLWVTLGAIVLISWNLYVTMQNLSMSSLLPEQYMSSESTTVGSSIDVVVGDNVGSNVNVTTSYNESQADDVDIDTSEPSPSEFHRRRPISWNTPLTEGVDPIYLQLLEEAERRSDADFEASHTRGNVGIVIGPTDGKFEHTVLALRSARRMRNMLLDRNVKIALLTSPEHIKILNKQCKNGKQPKASEYVEACRLWGNNTLFDDLVPIVDEYKYNDNFTKPIRIPSRYWMKSLGSYRHAPYKLSLILDSDAFTCPGFERLFALAKPRKQDVWQLLHQGETDFAAGIDQYPFGTGHNKGLVPGDAELLSDYFDFPERNTGTMILSFHRKLTHTFVHFVPLVAEYMWNHKASHKQEIVNDQTPFRVATYLFKRLRPDFVEQQIPQHTSCRTYPGNPQAGTNPETSRMLPLLADNTRCNDCVCSPCLIAHYSDDFPMPVQGRMGYEDDFQLAMPYLYP